MSEIEKKENDFRLSVSKTKTFLQCKKQYEFVYVHKLPRKDRDYHVFGKFCHKALEDFHNAYIKNTTTNPYNVEMGIAFKSAWQEFKHLMTKEMKTECWEILNKYLKKIIEDDKKGIAAKVTAVEDNFYFYLQDNIVLNGIIDRIQLDKDGILHVADYKTTKNKKYLKDDWFQLQTYCYVLMSKDESINKIRASYIMLRHDFEYITKDFTRDDIMPFVKDKYVKYALEMQNEKEFPANPSSLCSYCDHLDLCKFGLQKVNPAMKYGEINW